MDKYRLREIREEYNEINRDNGLEITQSEMANICMVGDSTISRIEKGETEPSPNVLIGYAKTFNVSTDYLLRLTDSKDLDNYMVSRELGLSDSAIETLKFIKENAAFKDYNLLGFISAFIGSGMETFSFFDDLFNMVSYEYGFSKYNEEEKSVKERYSDRLIRDMTGRIIEYIKYDIMPQLEKVIKDCYETLEEEIIHSPTDEDTET